jgi:hypothetical protein
VGTSCVGVQSVEVHYPQGSNFSEIIDNLKPNTHRDIHQRAELNCWY